MQPTILREISNVKFPSLIKLYVWENNINSLEALQFLDAPNLQELNLGTFFIIPEKNEICNLRPLKKLLSRQLCEINVSRNPVRKLGALEFTALG